MSRSIRVAPEHKQRVKVALKRHGFPSQNALAVSLGIGRSTTNNFFRGKAIDYSYFVEISERLGLDWEAIAYIEEDPPIELSPPSDTPSEEKPQHKSVGIDWGQVCHAMLEAQNQGRLTTNPLTTGDGVAFELDEIYVPLGLVERKQRDRRSGDVSPEQGSLLYEPEAQDEIVQTFQHDQFFEQVLRQGRSRKIAIIGEPGAGKTTLLQKIAAWVLDNTSDVPIWLSLADLQQGQTLKDYILQIWLERALPHIRKLSPKAVPSLLEVPKTLQDALADEFCNGRVWLLLDAADEMVVESGNALAQIANQLIGWIADARVVLTCRLNVWDAGKNALEAFDTYRNLDFSYGDDQTPDQVGQFIQRWFKSNPELGDRLRAELDQPGKERIKDAVKNPLRLALLCRTWALGQGRLPNTKAGLYQQFTEALYEWKQDRFPTSSSQRQELNKALGELALRAISEERTKFRLRHRLVESVLGKPDEDLFGLALQLGWLNQVGVAAEAENQGEKVYAFYHPTFQEYFAAHAISDWHYFLNHTPNNPAQGTYRIFEPQWKEVMKLWLGREDVPHEQKEKFIKALVEFEDGCKDFYFYKYRAYFLAAAGIAEFGDCSRAAEIVAQIVEWSFRYFSIEKQAWWTVLKLIQEGARAALQETDRSKAITALVQRIELSEDRSIRWQVADILGKIGTGNSQAIRELVQLIKSTKNEGTRRQAAYSLGKIGTGNPEAIRALVQLIESTEDAETRRQVAESLGKIGTGNPEAIRALVQLIESTKNESIRWQVAESLGKIGTGNPEAIAALVQLIKSTKYAETRRLTAYSLGKIGTDSPEVIAALVQLIKSTEDAEIRRQAANSLGNIGIGNPEAIRALVQLTESTKNESLRRYVAYSLGEFCIANPEAIMALVQLIESAKHEETRRQAVYSLGKIGRDNPEAIVALVQLIESTEDAETLRQAANSLGNIGMGNSEAIRALVQLIESTEDEYIRRRAANSLGNIGTGNPEATAALVQLIDSAKNEFTLRQAAYSLEKIDPGNPKAITALVQLAESAKNESTHNQATDSLEEINPGNPKAIWALVQLIKSTEDKGRGWRAVDTLKEILGDEQSAGIVTALKDYLSHTTYENDVERFFQSYILIWHCAQILPYPEFYQAWHNQPISSHPEVLENTTVDSNTFTQNLNLAELPQTLAAAIANDPTLSQTIHLICIDGSKFIDRDNPAAKIYAEMLKAGCPKCLDGTPKTMPELQNYWDLLESDKRVVLVFYEGTPLSIKGTQPEVAFSETFLDALSKFDGAICVITTQSLDNILLQCISPNEAIAQVVEWIKKITLEA